MKKIFYKIFLGYSALVLLLAATVLYFSFNIIRNSYQHTFEQELINLNHSIEYDIRTLLATQDFAGADVYAKELGKKIQTRITLIDTKGTVLADSKSDPAKMENHSDRPEVIKALSDETGTAVRHSMTVKKDMLYVAIPVKHEGKTIAVSRFSIFMDDFDNLMFDLKVRITIIVLIVLAVSFFLAYFFSRNITKPVKALVATSKEAAKGNFKARVKPTSNDELKLLALSYNNMMEKIDTLFTQTLIQKEELKNIIVSISEGLAVTDGKGLILHSNPSFDKHLNNNLPSNGKYIWEIVREVQVKKLLKKIQDSDESLSIELQIKEDFFLCSVNKINSNNELVFIFSNISEFKKLENMKKDFVVNVSHELRTPLTVIKGYLETLQDNPEGDNSKYIQVMQNHTNRLINIVQDLLSVSQLEDKNLHLRYSQVMLQKFFGELKISFEQKLKNKNLNLSINIANAPEHFFADEFKLEQMFINLVDNALKYTERGEISITANKENSYIRFEVADTGSGIPDKDKDRIFERFYTVDKSRSRQVSGTGLGLSIVKHIVLLHHGKIHVEDNPGGGSRFIIYLPLNSTDV